MGIHAAAANEMAFGIVGCQHFAKLQQYDITAELIVLRLSGMVGLQFLVPVMVYRRRLLPSPLRCLKSAAELGGSVQELLN